MRGGNGVTRKVPWTKLEELKGNPDVLARLDDAESLLRNLYRVLGLRAGVISG